MMKVMERAAHATRTWPVLGLSAVAAVVALAGLAGLRTAAPYLAATDLVRQGMPALLLALAAGLVTLSGRRRTGPLLLVVAALAAAAPGLSIGLQQRSAGWVPLGALGFVLAPAVVASALTFPDGGLPVRGRLLAAAVLATGMVAAGAEALTYDPAAWSWCRCVGNPLSVGVGPDGYLRLADLRTAGHALVAVLGILGYGVLRFRASGRRSTRLAFELVLLVLLAGWTVSDLADLASGETAPGLLAGVDDAALLLLPILYVAGYAGRRPSRAHVADLLLAVREEHDPTRLRDLVARALGDPQAVVAWWQSAPGEYRDHTGRPVTVPDRDVLTVDAAEVPVALVVSDRLDWVGPGVRDSLAEALRLAAENRRLTAELRASLDQVRESRARILTASDDARRRIERDLHDGAQQLLVSTGIKLNLAAARASGAGSTQDLVAALAEASEHLNRALAELRQVAGGIAPTALVHGSLTNALQELALRSTVPTTVRVDGEAVPDDATASTVYFVVAECLTNVAKHARAGRATVDVALEDPIRFSVTDDGCGGAVLDSPGSGLRGLVDRVDVRCGALDLASDASGTTVSVSLPLHVVDRSEP